MSRTNVQLPGKQKFCHPTCLNRTYAIQLDVTIARASDGTVTVAYDHGRTFPATPIGSDGTFTRSDPFTDANGDGVATLSGHLEPGRVVVVESFSSSYGYTAGMFAGWYDSNESTAAGQASF